MSISNLLSPNGYNLYCNSIQTPGDINEVVTKTVHLYSSANTDIFNGADLSLKYVVRNGICTMWLPTTATQTLATNNLNYTFLYLAESAGGYVDIPCPDTSGEKIFFPINVLTQGATFKRIANMEVDCNTGGEGNGRLIITLNGNVNVTSGDGSAGTPYVYALQAGSDVFNRNVAIYGFSISYPVEGAI